MSTCFILFLFFRPEGCCGSAEEETGKEEKHGSQIASAQGKRRNHLFKIVWNENFRPYGQMEKQM
jgi:hypothetical protein